MRFCVQGQNELFCYFFFRGGYIFRDLLTFYSLNVRFCYIFSRTYYCCGSVYPSVSGGGGKPFVRNVIIEINNAIMKIKWRGKGRQPVKGLVRRK